MKELEMLYEGKLRYVIGYRDWIHVMLRGIGQCGHDHGDYAGYRHTIAIHQLWC